MNLSVIIGTRNPESWLDKTLTGFALQARRDFEVIVADEGGSRSTSKLVAGRRQGYPVPLCHVRCSEAGDGEAIGQAIRAAPDGGAPAGALTPPAPTFNACNASAWKDDLLAACDRDPLAEGGTDGLGRRLEAMRVRGRRIRQQAVCLHLGRADEGGGADAQATTHAIASRSREESRRLDAARV